MGFIKKRELILKLLNFYILIKFNTEIFHYYILVFYLCMYFDRGLFVSDKICSSF